MQNVLTFSILLLLFASCKEKNKSIYEGCCGTEATVDSFRIAFPTYDQNGNITDSTSEANFYIPNIFTPDNDGDNDLFIVFSGPSISKVISMVCLSENIILFENANFQSNNSGMAWDGVQPDGTIFQGSFNYEVKVEFIDGQVKTYSGKACAYNCKEEGFPLDNLPNCFFPTQHDGNGGFDPSLFFPHNCF